MKYKSVFDIIGPVMIGPSSSHTAGAARIGRVARNLFGEKPETAVITFYGSFAKTYRGHGTDVAIVGGLLDFDTDDERIVNSLQLARDEGINVQINESDELTDHPNTAKVVLENKNNHLELTGISIGGGKIELIEIDGFELRVSGNSPAITVIHHDRYGCIANVAAIIAKHRLNIGHMDVSRKDKGQKALMTIEVDHDIEEEVMEEIRKLPNIIQVSKIVE